MNSRAMWLVVNREGEADQNKQQRNNYGQNLPLKLSRVKTSWVLLCSVSRLCCGLSIMRGFWSASKALLTEPMSLLTTAACLSLPRHVACLGLEVDLDWATDTNCREQLAPALGERCWLTVMDKVIPAGWSSSAGKVAIVLRRELGT